MQQRQIGDRAVERIKLRPRLALIAEMPSDPSPKYHANTRKAIDDTVMDSP